MTWRNMASIASHLLCFGFVLATLEGHGASRQAACIACLGALIGSSSSWSNWTYLLLYDIGEDIMSNH